MGATSSVGARLRDARRHLRLSQTAAASFADTSRQVIAAIEQGKRSPDLTQLVSFANLYRHSIDDFLSQHRFALRAAGAPAPAYHARFNSLEASVEDPEDRVELESFVAYLATRPTCSQRIHWKRGSFESISRTAEQLLRAWQRDRVTLPVQVFELASALGIEIRFTALSKLAGALIRGTDMQPPGMLINSDQPYDRQRFSAAHELGHHVLEHKTADPAFVSLLGRRFDSIEVQADQFAAELLVPEVQLFAELRKVSETNAAAPVRVRQLSRTFMVSYQAMTHRLERLGALDPQELDEVHNAKPSQIDDATRPKGRIRWKFSPSMMGVLSESAAASKGVITADTVRLLQETAFHMYRTSVPECDRADDASDVYERVALWVAREYPLVST